MSPLDLSVIVPVYNEAGSIVEFHTRLDQELASMDLGSEIVYINDGSTDSSFLVLKKHLDTVKHQTRVKIITLTTHQGQTAAIAAGIDAVSGHLVSFLDADLQNNPQDISKLVSSLDSDTDAVFGWRKNRSDRFDRVLASKVAHSLIRTLFDISLHDLGCSLRVVRRSSLEGLRLYGENHRLLPLLLVLQGARFKEVEVSHAKRKFDQSKYGYSRVVKVVIDLITTKFLYSYATKPAYIFGTWGLICLGLAIPALIQVIYRKLFLGVFVHLNPMFIIAMFLILIGIQLILLGLLAELMVRVYFESRKKPIYDIKETEDF